MSTKKKTTEQFIKEARIKHNGKYDYSLVEYNGNKKKVRIICPIHGEFKQTPDRHLHTSGCKKCAAEKRGLERRKTFEDFVKKSNIVHNRKYTYVKETFVKGDVETKIICPIHGEFWQTPDSHMQGHGCQKCKSDKLAELRKEEFGDFIENARNVHKDRYDYSLVNYIDNTTPIDIICPKHGKFSQSPRVHLRGGGCYLCNNSHLEETTENILTDLGITYIEQQRFDWLINEKKMPLDFYIPDYNIAIECQGDQHIYNRDTYYNKDGQFEKRIMLDKLKYRLCIEHNIRIIYIFSKRNSKYRLDEQFNHMYDDALFIEDIMKDNNILLNRIEEWKGK